MRKTVVTLGLLSIALMMDSCGGSSEIDIYDTVETEVQAATKATIPVIPALSPVSPVGPVHMSVSTPIPPAMTPEAKKTEEGAACTLSGGEVVKKGWSGKDTGANYCNQCMCLDAGLACTKMACPAVQLPVNPTLAPPNLGEVLTLKIIEIATNIPDYDRSDWKHWTDVDRDCQNTRHEVLIEESVVEVNFKTGKQCQVATGEWLDPYTGLTVTDATKLDVDHMVPLKNAHDSGAWSWGRNRKAAYANEMAYNNHLIVVTATANRKKGAKGPEGWKPDNQDYWCTYAVDWVQIKIDWELTVTKSEWSSLQEMLGTCSRPPSIRAIQSKADTSSASNPTISSPTVISTSHNIEITSIDCKGKPEIVVIMNTGDSPQKLTGWKLQDEGSKNTFTFPINLSLAAGSSVKLISGESGNHSVREIYWNDRPIWNNDGDTATLFNSTDQVVSEMECP